MLIETMLGLSPLHIFIECEARSSAYRIIKNNRQMMGVEEGHSKILTRILKEPLLAMLSDLNTVKYLTVKNFTVHISDRGEWESKLPNFIHGYRSKANDYYNLGKYATVFQTEIFAITRCAQINNDKPQGGKLIYILSDSQSFLKALTAHQN
jgi:hypothetical protein